MVLKDSSLIFHEEVKSENLKYNVYSTKIDTNKKQ